MEEPAYPFRAKSSIAAFNMPLRARFIGTLLYRSEKLNQQNSMLHIAALRPPAVFSGSNGILRRYTKNCTEDSPGKSGDLRKRCEGCRVPGNSPSSGLGTSGRRSKENPVAPGPGRRRQNPAPRRGGVAPAHSSRIGRSFVPRESRRHQAERICLPPRGIDGFPLGNRLGPPKKIPLAVIDSNFAKNFQFLRVFYSFRNYLGADAAAEMKDRLHHFPVDHAFM